MDSAEIVAANQTPFPNSFHTDHSFCSFPAALLYPESAFVSRLSFSFFKKFLSVFRLHISLCFPDPKQVCIDRKAFLNHNGERL